MIKPVVEDVEFEVGEQRPDVFHGFELLKLVRMDIDHESLEAAEVVAVETILAGRNLAISDFFDQRCGELPAVSVVGDDDRLAFVGNDLGLAGDFAETELLAILLDGSFAALGVIRVHHLIKRLEVIAENLRVSSKTVGSRFLVTQARQSNYGLIGGGAIDTRRQFVIHWPEDMNLANGKPSFTITTSGHLDNRIQRPKCTPDSGEIHVHSGFDELGGDDAARLAGSKAITRREYLQRLAVAVAQDGRF